MALAFRAASAEDTSVGSLLKPEGDAVPLVLDIPVGFRSGESVVHTVVEPRSHILVHAASRAEAIVCLDLRGGERLSCDIEILVDDEATLRLLCLQSASSDASVRIRQRSRIGTGAALTLQNVTLGGNDVAHDLVSTAEGRDAESSVDWMFYARNAEKQELSARNVFHASGGKGEILMKGVAQDTAHAAADGLIEIGLKGAGTNTYLTQDVLMLDTTAKVDAVPGLEIKTNDVKASHSATVSRVTAEDLFYFAARGIPRDEAREMYILGFLGQITARIADEAWRDRILQGIQRKYAVGPKA